MLARRAFLLGVAMAAARPAHAQKRGDTLLGQPSLSASRRVMAGSMLSVFARHAPAGSRLAIARPDDPADRAIVVLSPVPASATLQTPGEPGRYELRLTTDRNGQPVVLLRQPLETTAVSATVQAPSRISRGQQIPVRGIGPNGEQDRVVLVPADAAPGHLDGPTFFPAENVEAMLDAPDKPGRYEVRYLMHAPLAERRVLARQIVDVD